MKLKHSLALMVIALSFQVNAQKVTVDLDKNVDFSKFKSITFLGWQKGSDKLLNDLDKERMRNAFISEFKSRGLEKGGEDADLAITLYCPVLK